VDQIAGDFASEKDKDIIRQKLGLNQPLPTQILHYYEGLLHGDLGTSLVVHQPVTEMIGERIKPTAELALVSILFTCLFSIPIGAASALQNRTWFDLLITGTSLLGISMPNFWLGPLLILLFSIHLGWLPVSGRTHPSSIILPALALSSSLSAVLIRVTKTSVLEQMHEDYIRTARSKGLKERTILFKHILKNSAISITTVIGLQFGALVTGTIITEKVFDWPGLGTLIAEAIERRDYPVVQGCVFVFSLAFLFTNLLTDIIYFWLDPRIRMDKSK
jgi:peptide/nickel transport system permease protein